jgi:F1F0 ATPase subunit 2
MADLLRVLLPVAGGAVLGLCYFGGLWLTVQRLPQTRRPALLTLTSFVTRTGLAALGFVALLGGDPLRLAVALVTFMAVRVVLVRRVRLDLVTGGGGAP